MLESLTGHLRYAILVLLVVVVIILLSRWTGKTIVPAPGRLEVVHVVTKAMAENQAARLKGNRLEALLDVTAALATIRAAASLAGHQAVEHVAGGSVRLVEEQLLDHQQQIISDLRPKSLLPLPKI